MQFYLVEKRCRKIQYPAIGNSIKSDINLIRKFSNLKRSITPIIDEVEEKLYEEIDYRIELKNTKFARENLSSKDIIVHKHLKNTLQNIY